MIPEEDGNVVAATAAGEAVMIEHTIEVVVVVAEVTIEVVVVDDVMEVATAAVAMVVVAEAAVDGAEDNVVSLMTNEPATFRLFALMEDLNS